MTPRQQEEKTEHREAAIPYSDTINFFSSFWKLRLGARMGGRVGVLSVWLGDITSFLCDSWGGAQAKKNETKDSTVFYFFSLPVSESAQ